MSKEASGSLPRGALEGIDLPWPVARARRLGLHASKRSFFRLVPEAPVGGRRSTVLVVYPRPGAEAEIDRYRRAATWFRDAGVRVPEIYAVGGRSVLVEDLGDDLLADRPVGAERRRRCYRQAADAVVSIQRHGLRAEPPNRDQRLDRDRLRSELAFAERHAVVGWLGTTAGAAVRDRVFDRLAELAARGPATVCHRDFHARNLMVHRGRVAVVDFQDVMRGPALYDLASLLWDNYCDVGSTLRAITLRRYRGRRLEEAPPVEGRLRIPGSPPGLPAAHRQAICLVALQRCLKALGTFGFQISVRGRPEYRDCAARTWSHVRTLAGELGWDELLSALAPFRRLDG